jgi:hypothetical protein
MISPHHELRCRVPEEHPAVEGTSSDVSRFPPNLDDRVSGRWPGRHFWDGGVIRVEHGDCFE